MTKTCVQNALTAHGWRKLRRPHQVDPATAGGYDDCRSCGQSIYVGQGERSVFAAQRREHLAARADRYGEDDE